MWLLVGGRGWEIDISAAAICFSLGAASNGHASVVQAGAVDYR